MTSDGWAQEPAPLTYAIDLSRFADGDGDGFGDLRGALSRLEHVASLGVSWIWLLPLYPSLRRDNGYDVDDHCAVDPRFGTIDDVAAFLDRAHQLGMGVLFDFVAHHTSDRHQWFRKAREDPTSRIGRYYVWSADDGTEPGDRPMFPGEESSVWEFDQRAGLYYHHQFYRFQPDLNATNPDVVDELVRIGTFWLELGADGFRIDAALLLAQGKGRPGTDPEDRELFDNVRSRLSEVRSDVALLAEADESPELLATVVENHRFDAVMNFSLNGAVYLALTREDASPIRECLDRLDGSVPASARLNFIRNGDELDLEQLAQDEREEVFRRFAPESSMLIYDRGIRRSWAPMMQPKNLHRMTLSLLMALPGVPLLMAGQEIGVGDDLNVDGRDAGRTTMQWDASAWGGFTGAATSPLTLPAQSESPFGWPTVNVAAQEEDPGSLLALTRRLSSVRRGSGAGTAGWSAFEVSDPAVLALRRGDALVLHNLADRDAVVDLTGEYGEAHFTVELGEGWDGITLGPYGFAWLYRD